MKPLKGWLYRSNNFIAVFVLCIFLSSCSSLPSQLTIENPQWQIKGKIGYKNPGQKSGSASFTWQEDFQTSLIHVFNPLGQHLFTLYQNDTIAIFQQADGKQETASSAEALLNKMSNFSFPVKHASYWIQGKLSGTEQAITRDKQLRIQSFNAENWQATWQYKGDKTNPFKIKLQQQNTQINIIIKSHEQF